MPALKSRIGCAELIESFMYQIQLLFIQFSTWFNIFMLYPASILSISLSNENEWMNEIWLSYAGIISWFNLQNVPLLYGHFWPFSTFKTEALNFKIKLQSNQPTNSSLKYKTNYKL